jgi:hypothetical protein
MKNIIIASILLLCVTEVHAQKWFTPQAKWYRDLGNALEISKEKDTLIDNKLCVKLAARYKDKVSQQWIAYPRKNMIVYDDTTAKIQYVVVKGQFYVLYDFNKNIGDTVFTLGIDNRGYQGELDSGAWSVIDSVGIDTIMGIAYKTIHYKEILKADEDVIWPHYDWRFSGKIIETIGNLSNFMPMYQNPSIPNYDDILRCFENEYINLKLTDYPCDTSMGWVAVTEVSEQTIASLSPNPFYDVLELNFKQPLKEGSLLILNQLGKTIWEYSIEPFNEKQSLNLTQLTPGLYYCHVISQGQTQTFKIIKR